MPLARFAAAGGALGAGLLAGWAAAGRGAAIWATAGPAPASRAVGGGLVLVAVMAGVVAVMNGYAKAYSP